LLPGVYEANTPFTLEGYFAGSFESLQINATSYVMALPGGQEIAVNFQTVPEAGTAAFLLGGVGLAGFTRRRRKGE
jgi:MYXO-CTERM domain-containing protein